MTDHSPYSALAASLVDRNDPSDPTSDDAPHCISSTAERHAGADDMLDYAVRAQQMDRIEDKVDLCLGMMRLLIAALANEEESDLPEKTLDGDTTGGERDQSQSLG